MPKKPRKGTAGAMFPELETAEPLEIANPTDEIERVDVKLVGTTANGKPSDDLWREIERRLKTQDFLDRIHAIIYCCNQTLHNYWPQKPDGVAQIEWDSVIKRVAHVQELSPDAPQHAIDALKALHEVRGCDERLAKLGTLPLHHARELSMALCHAINLGQLLQRIQTLEHHHHTTHLPSHVEDVPGAAQHRKTEKSEAHRQIAKDLYLEIIHLKGRLTNKDAFHEIRRRSAKLAKQKKDPQQEITASDRTLGAWKKQDRWDS